MIIFQFCAAIVLISFTLLVKKQIDFGTSDLGYQATNVIGIKMTKQLKKDILKDRLINLVNVQNVSLTQFYPGKQSSFWSREIAVGGENKYVGFDIFDADASFIDIMKIELVAGRFFSDTIISDRNCVLINESFVKEYMIENPLELTIPGFQKGHLYVVGVVKDFHYKSKGNQIGPLVIKNTGYASYCLAELSSENFSDLKSTLEHINGITSELSPDFPVEVSFLDDAIESMYQSEIQFQRAFTFFAGCAIFISCLGILALSLFTSQQRTKEIGIRKVNGAHVEDILLLLNKNFLRWVAIAFIIASPIAWFSMNAWLEGFAYKTEISWWIFLVGGGIALLIALLTVSWQSWRAARRNPVEALRYE